MSLLLALSIRNLVLKDEENAESSDRQSIPSPYLDGNELPSMTPTSKSRHNQNDKNTCLAPHKSKRDRISRSKMRRKHYADGTAAAAAHHQFVPGTLELLSERGVVCPGQTLEDILHDGVRYTTPETWNKTRTSTLKESVPIVVFKRGGSGSTWFDSTLANHPEIKFTHEIQKYFRSSDAPKDKTEVLVDYLTTPKFEQKYRGFSISPSKHGKDVDWDDVFERSGAALVVFMRTNVVKRRVGMIRKGMVMQLPEKCRFGGGGGHLKPPSVTNKDDCSIGKTKFDEEELDRLDGSCWLQTWGMMDMALSMNVPFQVITFEGMEQSVSQTMKDVGLYTDWDDMATYNWEEDTTTVKVTPEDLESVLSNYEQVKRQMKDRGLNCYIDMLRAQDEHIFPLCVTEEMFDGSSTTQR